MNKRILSAVIITMLLLSLFVSPVMAYDSPIQDSDNATDIILWHGDTGNITILSNNVSITNPVTVTATVEIKDTDAAMEKAMIAFAKEIGAQLAALFWIVLEAIAVFYLVYLAYRFGDRYLYWFAGFGLGAYGVLVIWDKVYYLGVLLVVTGAYTLYKAKFDKRAWGKDKNEPRT